MGEAFLVPGSVDLKALSSGSFEPLIVQVQLGTQYYLGFVPRYFMPPSYSGVPLLEVQADTQYQIMSASNGQSRITWTFTSDGYITTSYGTSHSSGEIINLPVFK